MSQESQELNQNLYQAINEDADLDRVKSLLDSKGNPSIVIHLAVEKNRAGLVQVLLDAKANVNLKDKNFNRPLHIAAALGFETVVLVLLDAKADINAKRLGSAKWLNKVRGIPDVNNGDENTPLHLAANHGHSEVVRQLLKRRAAIDIRNWKGEFATYLAFEGKVKVNSAAIKALLDAKAWPTVREKEWALERALAVSGGGCCRGIVAKQGES